MFYVHIELVTSSGKCSLFFFLKFYVCVKANLKVMILLITVRDHLAQVFTRVDDFSFTSAQKYSDIWIISAWQLAYFSWSNEWWVSIHNDIMKPRIHTYIFFSLIFFFFFIYVFALLISHARLPLRSKSNQSYTRTYHFGNDIFVFL
jgi:hypothetical protein